ncbi:hypothetical protein [Hymenobacter koreensis]|uniref:Uncharacterized protein n=1 Tax=Hymenobacter koreensis TaxID=1084523 RepID=A0ABP8JHF8_9BACT
MKTLAQQASRFLFLAAFAALGLAPAAQATTPDQPRPQPISVQQVADYTYVVRVSNPTLERSQVQLVRLSNNTVLFRKSHNGPAFGHKLNVEQLPDGEYAFEVKVGKQTHRYTLDIHTQMQRSARLGSVSLTAMAAE